MSTERFVHPKTLDDYNRIIRDAKACLVDIGATWCGPCKMLGKQLDSWINSENLFKNVTVVKVDTDDGTPLVDFLCENHKIAGIPRLLFYKEGKLMHDVTGCAVNDIKKKLGEINM
jgi:thioredoxin 1